MKFLELKTKAIVLHAQKKIIKDKLTDKEIAYFENTILCPSLFEGVEKATSSTEVKPGEHFVKIFVRPGDKELKLKLVLNADGENKK